MLFTSTVIMLIPVEVEKDEKICFLNIIFEYKENEITETNWLGTVSAQKGM